MRIGDKITFTPLAWTGEGMSQEAKKGSHSYLKTTGVIVGVNRGHHWYRVAFDRGDGQKGYECFHYIPDGNDRIRPLPGQWGIEGKHYAVCRNG